MLKFFIRRIIGGRSGKREAAWAVFLLWVAAFIWSAVQEVSGASVSGIQSILSAALMPVLGLIAIAHGMEWISKQTEWGGKPDVWRDDPPFD